MPSARSPGRCAHAGAPRWPAALRRCSAWAGSSPSTTTSRWPRPAQPGGSRDPARRDPRHARAQPRAAVRPLLPAGRGSRARWERLWLAELRGVVLPPISVIAVGGAYVLRDGHHRVSVALARGAVAIDAAIDIA